MNKPVIMSPQSPRAVSHWLFWVAFFVFLLVLVGGLTRLTDSGLSITEWKPITGSIPPLSDTDWQSEFEKYKTIPEYELVNKGFSMEEFKFIYWWEWAHRFLARLVGLVFFIPFVYFLTRQQIPKSFKKPLWGLLALGGLQGVMGWYMVSSGLSVRVDVSQYRLAMHLGLALIIFSYAFWLGLKLRLYTRHQETPASGRPIAFAGVLVFLVFMQSLMGALVAGLKAGKTYTDWPFMDGDLIPSNLFEMSPVIINFFENYVTVQFDHRIGAYLLLILVFWHAYQQNKVNAASARSAFYFAVAVSGQAILGIVTLILAVPIALGAAHQIGAVLVLSLALYHFHDMRFPKKSKNY